MRKRSVSIAVVVIALLLSAWGNVIAAAFCPRAFIIIQSIIVIIWMVLNVVGFISHWDVYPFILPNLVFSTQAAYAAPIIMMSQNRSSDRDRQHADADYQTNI
jgi:uncharacterized membrane protein